MFSSAAAPLPLGSSVVAAPAFASPAPVFAEAAPMFVEPAPVVMPAPMPMPIVDNNDLNPGTQAEFEERAEFLEDYWQYSRCALPCLMFIGMILFAVLLLSLWQTAGDVKDWHDGVARHMRLNIPGTDDDGGAQESEVRNMRIVAAYFGFIAPIVAFITYAVRPQAKPRKLLVAICLLLLLVAAIFSWISFARGVDSLDEDTRTSCPWGSRFTFADCKSLKGLATGATVMDAALGFFALVAFVLLLVNGLVKSHWRMPARSLEEERDDLAHEKAEARVPGEMIHKNVSWVRKALTAIFLVLTLVAALAVAALLFVNEAHEAVEYNANSNGRVWELEGWPVLNSRLRLTALTIGLFTILLNFMPFRSRTAAMIFGFLFLVCAVLIAITFSYDWEHLEDVNDMVCPNTTDGRDLDCSSSSFVATVVLEVIAVLLIFGYLVYEYLHRRGAVRRTLDPVHRP